MQVGRYVIAQWQTGGSMHPVVCIAGLLVVWSLCFTQPTIAEDGCSRPFDPRRDDYPRQIGPSRATGFEVEYHRSYKVVTVKKPWNGATRPIRYLLLRCGAPDPGGFDDAQRVTIPVKRLISLSTTHLPHLELLDVTPTLVAIGSIDQVNSPLVRRRYEEGLITEVGRGESLQIERVVELAPDVVLTDADSRARFNSHPALERAGIPVAIAAEYLEDSILGRSEWLLFTALFYDLELRAQSVVADIFRQYEHLSRLVAEIPRSQRPSVFGGSLWGDVWYVAGGKSFPAQLFSDAGGNYLWSDDTTREAIPLDFEMVYELAADADFWLPAQNAWFSQSDALASDRRYAAFAAMQKGRVFNFNARVNQSGGNDYWERGLVEPHVVLADVIRILHPAVLPDHELQYLRKLD